MSDDSNNEALVVLALEYLNGRLIEKDGKVLFEYLGPGSERELKAKMALIKLLNEPSLDERIRNALGLLLAPTQELGKLVNEYPREFVIQPRRGGTQPRPELSFEIALYVASAVYRDTNLDTAVYEAAQRYGVSERTVRRAWGKERMARSFAKAEAEADHPVLENTGEPD